MSAVPSSDPAPTRLEIHSGSRATQVPLATISMLVFHGLDVDMKGVRVVMDDETQQALITLGWTPPEHVGLKIDIPQDLTPEQAADFERRFAERMADPGAYRVQVMTPLSDDLLAVSIENVAPLGPARYVVLHTKAGCEHRFEVASAAPSDDGMSETLTLKPASPPQS